MDLAGVLSVIGYAIEVLIGVGLIIFVHELGHFLAAKWAGVKVRRFFFGFAPAFNIGKRKIKLQFFAIQVGETKYGLGMLPFGGFIDMAGEMGGETQEKDSDVPKERQFTSKSAGQRAIIFAAGAAMNAVFAIIFFIIAFSIGVSFVRPTVGQVVEGLPAWQAGIEPGDKILEINGREQREFMEILMHIALVDPDTRLNMKIQRGEEVFNTQVTPVADPGGKGMTIGVSLNAEPVIEIIKPGHAADKAGLKLGDRILSIQYTDPETGRQVTSEVRSYLHVNNIVQDARLIGKPIQLEVERASSGGSEILHLTLVPEVYEEASKLLGIAPHANQVLATRNGSSAAESLKAGDIIETALGRKVYSRKNLLELAASESEVTLGIIRKSAAVNLTLRGEELRAWLKNEVALAPADEKAVVGYVQPGMPAAAAGMKPGDRIVELNGYGVEKFREVAIAIRSNPDEPVTLKWLREGENGQSETFTAVLSTARQPVGYIGVGYREERFKHTEGFFGAIGAGFNSTVLWGKRVFLILKGLFAGGVSPRHLAGPVGIVTISYAVTQYGIGTLLYFLAMISINLAIINIFPIPVLDGGHLLFLAIEKIKGSPVTIKTQIMAQTVGLALLLMLAVFVTINDITRLITGF